MYMLNTGEYKEEKIQKALAILYKDRSNEFEELSKVILTQKVKTIPNWKEFILNFCLDVGDSFKTWTGQKSPSKTSPQKALAILRNVGKNKTSMNQISHILNISYTISNEFKEIYNSMK